jgi:Zinc carboxypeptidase
MLRYAVAIGVLVMSASGNTKQLTTVAEQSGWIRTGRYEEVLKLCPEFEKAYPGKVRCFQFGTTAEGRPMMAMAVSADGKLSAELAHSSHRPVLYFQGGIHSGEIDGKDAGFWLIRDLLEGNVGADILSKVILLFVPVFNIDGHERAGKWNRPNQIGPEEMGWRTTAQNLNLNRDHLKVEAPEMKAMLTLLRDWDPLVYVDMHVTDGSDFEPDVAVLTEPKTSGSVLLRPVGKKISEDLMQRMTERKHLPLPFYPSYVDPDEPLSGCEVVPMPPRFSHSYWAERNRFGVLVETHSWKDYATRVRTTYDVMLTVMELAAKEGLAWKKAAEAADEEARDLGGKQVVLEYKHTGKKRVIPFRGFAYIREKSEVSGVLRTKYDPTRPQVWNLPLFDELVPAISVEAPRWGYYVPAAHAAWVAEKLKYHGIEYQTVKDATPHLNVEAYRFTLVNFAKAPFEGRLQVKTEGHWASENRTLPAGSLFVPIAQPKARLVLHLLEPSGPDSLVAWGFFNAVFEQKESMENYVAEAVGEEMLKNPKIKTEFENKMAKDSAFAKDPQARLLFFYEKHPSWDEQWRLYPVYRAVHRP